MAAPWKKTKTPGIYKRTLQSGDIRYVAMVRDRSGKQRKLTRRTLAEAREAKADYASSGGHVPPNRESFEDYACAWIESYSGRRGGIEPTTVEGYRAVLEKYVFPRLGGHQLGTIGPRDVKALVVDLQKIKQK